MNKKINILIIALITLLIGVSSCKRNSIPCPGNGVSSARDLSLFDEGGDLKSDKKKNKKTKKDEQGLVNKKKDTRLKAHRKEHLGDVPKKMKR